MTGYVEYNLGRVIKEKEKAILVSIDGLDHWFPRSVVIQAGDKLLVAEWFDKKRQQSGAMFSEDNTRRMFLWRHWNTVRKTALVIGLNPSTANASSNDPTIDRLIKTLNKLGYGGLRMVNLFSVISSNPEILLDPKHHETEDADMGLIFGNAICCQEIVFAWGGFKQAGHRAQRVIDFFADGKCFGKNLNGSPWHPQAMMYAGLKPDSGKIRLFKFSDHKFEDNVYDRKERRKKAESLIEQQHKQIGIHF